MFTRRSHVSEYCEHSSHWVCDDYLTQAVQVTNSSWLYAPNRFYILPCVVSSVTLRILKIKMLQQYSGRGVNGQVWCHFYSSPWNDGLGDQQSYTFRCNSQWLDKNI